MLILSHDLPPPSPHTHRHPGTAAAEKKRKKKGKRRSQEPSVQDGGESDTTSASALGVGGQYGQDSLDNSVS